MFIIGISGYKGSGKSTVAEIMANNGWTIISMADPLKDTVSVLFGLDRNLLSGDTKESRLWREQELKEYSYLAGKGLFKNDSIITPRIILQRFGTDFARNQLSEDHWRILFMKRIQNYIDTGTNRFVVPDCRFPNELSLCNRTIHIIRDSTIPTSNVHPSEESFLSHKFSLSIDNNGTIRDLEEKTLSVISHIEREIQ